MARKLHFTCQTGVVAANVQPVTNMFGQTLWLTLLVSMCGSSDGSSRPEMAMSTTHFGVTWSWHEQFSKGILHHDASLQGESFVHDFEGIGLSHGHERMAEAATPSGSSFGKTHPR